MEAYAQSSEAKGAAGHAGRGLGVDQQRGVPLPALKHVGGYDEHDAHQ